MHIQINFHLRNSKVFKMDISHIKIGIDNTYIPPFKNNIKTTRIYENDGFDSLWFGDHIMGWNPEAIWTPDIVNIALFQKNPHDLYNVFPTLAIVANNTKKALLGTAVTEIFRHHPALLAHLIITLDHISRGRIILGIGAGEGENIVPYGIKWEKSVSRLEEAIKIIKLLWEKDKKVDYDGEIWKLNDAVLSLNPYKKGNPPPIWVAAHGPKMLELTGKVGDGWLPIYLNPDRYKECLNTIHISAKKEGRNPDNIIPAVYFNIITDEKPEECDRMLESPLAKNHMLVASNEQFQRYGISHPLGDDFYGLINYIPTKYDKKTLLEIYEKVPSQMCKELYLNGTPDQVIGKIEEYAKIGAEHIVLFNHTPLCDIDKISTSYICIKKVLDYFKGK